jgi:hypothetical protein
MITTITGSGFQPNSNKKIYHVFKTTDKNPFTVLAESTSECPYYRDELELLLIKILPCEKHEIYGLLHNIDSYRNVWRILEVLHYILPKKYNIMPKFWQQMIKHLAAKAFHRDIKNMATGETKILNFCYVVLEHLLDFMINKNDGQFNMNNDPPNHNWRDISILCNKIVSFLADNDYLCSCNEPRDYPSRLLDNIKSRHKTLIRTKLEKWLNTIDIVWDNLEGDYNEPIVKKGYLDKVNKLYYNPPEKAIKTYAKVIPWAYDLLPESLKLEYIKMRIYNSTYHIYYDDKNVERSNNEYYLGDDEEIPVLRYINAIPNQCFVCDTNLFKNHRTVSINKGVITEIESQYNGYRTYTHPIIHRCEAVCKKGKYGQPILNNDEVILARHYKWMTFYAGFYDTKCILANVPFDIAKLIIVIYQTVR